MYKRDIKERNTPKLSKFNHFILENQNLKNQQILYNFRLRSFSFPRNKILKNIAFLEKLNSVFKNVCHKSQESFTGFHFSNANGGNYSFGKANIIFSSRKGT